MAPKLPPHSSFYTGLVKPKVASVTHRLNILFVSQLFSDVLQTDRMSYPIGLYYGSWCHLSVKIFVGRCHLEIMGVERYIYIDSLYSKFQLNQSKGSSQRLK